MAYRVKEVSLFGFSVTWYPFDAATAQIRVKLSFKNRWWMYHRLANAGRLQINQLCLTWPLPWAKGTRDLPGYGRKV